MSDTTKLTEQEAILLEIAIGKTYETEYVGGTYDRCMHCEEDVGDLGKKSHPEYCLMERSRKVLGDKWQIFEDKRIKAEQEEEAKRKHAIQKEIRLEDERRKRVSPVECERCGKTVAKGGLSQHQTSISCAKRAANRITNDIERIYICRQ